MNRKSKILLLHTINDRNPVKERLIFDLQRLDYIELWRVEQISVGQLWSEKISQAIGNSDYILQIISENTGIDEFYNLLNRCPIYKKPQFIFAETIDDDAIFQREISQQLSDRIHTVGIGFGDYERAFTILSQYIKVNESDSIIQFQLDIITNKNPIILITEKVNEKLINYFSKNPNELKIIDRRLFEEFIAELFGGFGYQVELTQKTRDGGRDIIAIKNAETIDKYLIECKRPDIGNIIGIKPVRELFGVKQDEKATKAILATTSYFSKDAQQFFERNKWELEPKDFDGIMNWINQYKKMKNIT